MVRTAFPRSRGLCVVGLALLPFVPRLAAAEATLVRDINRTTQIRPSQPRGFATVGDRTYFAAFGEGTSWGLYSTDVTTPGASLIHSTTGYELRFAALGSRLVYLSYQGLPGELWSTDGTPDGTVELAANVYDGPVVVGDRVLFAAQDDHGVQLWVSDGSPEGTHRLRDIGAGDNEWYPQVLTVSGGMVFFIVDDGVHGVELWVSDGTDEGTHLVRDVGPGASGIVPDLPFHPLPPPLADVDGTLFFAARDGEHGVELWRSDGTEEGTRLVRDINPGNGASTPFDLTAFGGRLFFGVYDASFHRSIWASDGSEAGTRPIGGRDPFFLRAAGDTLYFLDTDTEHGTELWRSDGASVALAGEIRLGPDGAEVSEIVAVGDGVFLSADDGISGRELWHAQNGGDGVTRVRDIAPGATGSNPQDLAVAGDTVIFSADDGAHGREVWRSDGTEAGTVLWANILTDDTPAGSNPSGLFDLHGTLLFSADDGVHGSELWASGGSEASTRMLADIHPSGSGVSFGTDGKDFAVLGDRAVFRAQEPNGRRLWSTDGTAAGTSPVDMRIDVFPGLVRFGDAVFFSGIGEDGRRGLWRTDGTAAGTYRVTGSDISSPALLTVFGDRLFFIAEDGTHGRELWATDGTAEGTQLVRDVNPTGSAFSRNDLAFLTGVGDTLFFAADDGVHGAELWKTDGTELGTALVRDINPGVADATLSLFSGADVGGRLVFIADDGAHGMEPWSSDGSAAGTQLVRDVNPGAASSVPPFAERIVAGGKLYFPADDGEHGVELWRSDGTALGTGLLADIEPGPDNSWPSFFATLGERVVFSACNTANGCEPWEVQGSSAPAILDLFPGADSSGAYLFTPVGGRVFFAAYQPEVGSELFAVDRCSADCNANAVVTVDEIVRAVRIALEAAPLADCRRADGNSDGRVTIDELVAAVSVALNGCTDI